MRCTRRWLWLLALALAPAVPGTVRANDTCANCSGNLVSCVEDARAEKLVCREDCKASRHAGGGANCMRGCRKRGATDRKACRETANTCAATCVPPDDPTCNPGGCSRDLEDCMHDAARSLPACLDTCPKGKGRKACVKGCQAFGQSGRDFCHEENQNCLGNCSGSTTTTTMVCSTTTSSSTSTTCNTSTTTTTIPSTCGNGRMDPGEECDGNQFCNAHCPGGSADGGFTDGSPGGGFLVCTPQCTIDFSHCPGATTSSTIVTGTTSTSLPGGVTTTTVVGGTTSTTIGGGTGTILSFVTGAPAGTCGAVRAGGATVKSLGCGGLNVGGGAATVAEGPTPGGAETQLALSGGPTTFTVGGRSAAATGSVLNCSDTGCNFGPYLPIANAGTSTCVLNTFSAPASGTLNATTGAFTGSFPLTSTVFLTANATAPCPRCLGGVPGGTDSGNCEEGWKSAVGTSDTEGDPCTPTDAAGDTYDCTPPAAAMLPAFPVNLTPITTGTATKTAAGGLFCPGQPDGGAFGCSGTGAANAVCPGGNTPPVPDTIEEVGSPAATIGGGTSDVTLASVFCIPEVGGDLGFLINAAANLPGPGATSLPGTFEIH